MTLYQKIQEDVKSAMRAKDIQTLDTLRMLSSSLKNKMIELREDLSDSDVIAIIRSDVKKLTEAMKDYTDGARADLVEKAEAEIALLKTYLPQEMSQDELEEKIRMILGEKLSGDVQDVGKAMGVVMADLKGLVDGTRVRETVSKLIKKLGE